MRTQQGAGREWPRPSLNKGEEVRRFSFVSDKGKELAKKKKKYNSSEEGPGPEVWD